MEENPESRDRLRLLFASLHTQPAILDIAGGPAGAPALLERAVHDAIIVVEPLDSITTLELLGKLGSFRIPILLIRWRDAAANGPAPEASGGRPEANRTAPEHPAGVSGFLCRGDLSPGELERELNHCIELGRLRRRLADVEEQLFHARAQAGESAKTKSEFLANMSHELRTPLNAILGMADLLMDTPLSPDQKKYVETSRRASHQLLQTINDILEFSRVQAGDLEIARRPFDIEALINKVMDMMDRRGREKGLKVGCAIDAGIPRKLVGDADHLNQVLVTMLGNAIKFTASGSIFLKVESASASAGRMELLFTISDTGVGIPEKRSTEIFSGFTQLEDSLTRRHGGTGLGLATAKILIEKMGGKLWFKSREGEGSTFFVQVPLEVIAATNRPSVTAHATPAATPAVATDPVGDDSRILLADDSTDARALYAAFLRSAGYTVDTAEDGLQALEMLEKRSYNLVFLDMEMPNLDGYETAQRIRQRESAGLAAMGPAKSRRNVLVALTAHSLAEEQRRCLDCGCDACLVKPADRQQITDVTRRFLARTPNGGLAAIKSPGEPIRVKVPAELQDLIPRYLENRKRDLDLIATALQGGDFTLLYNIAHKLKGSGGGYGFQEITNIGREMETAAEEQNAAGARTCLEKLRRYLELVVVMPSA